MQPSFVEEMNRLGAAGEDFFFAISYDMSESIISVLSETAPAILFNFNGTGNHSEPAAVAPENIKPLKYTGYHDFSEKFKMVQHELRAGNSYLVNLTFSTPLEDCNLKNLYLNAKAPYRLYVKDSFTLFSPETFVKIRNNCIYTYPMKGTAEGTEIDKQRLLYNEKEQAEHITVVDLLRNDLNRVAEGVRVDRYRFVESIKKRETVLYQTSSEISGRLSENWRSEIGSILYELLPAGSITGAPKHETVEMIECIEDHYRGFFTGICGICNSEGLDSAVMIRFIEKTENGYFFKSGGGITVYSDMKAEYDEYRAKIYVPVD